MGSISIPLIPIPTPTSLIAVRTGKLKPLGSLAVKSGIIKENRHGRVHVSKLGLTDDEHDLTFHGGIDKAIHQYCLDHYPLWKQLYPDPEVAARFEPGGFGENLVVEGWSEESICIGDIVRIGLPKMRPTDREEEEDPDSAVVLEVSLPRQPCFKLNQRFGIKNFAGRTHALNRTGWYYRVVQEGWISAGMEISIIKRPHPKWTIAQLHQYVHRDTDNKDVMEELVTIQEMGKECRGTFERRLKKMHDEEKGILIEEKKETWKDYKIVEKRLETSRIVALSLEAVDQATGVQDIEPGSHVRLKLPLVDGKELIRPYSVVGGSANRFTLGIANGELSRGGSRYIHDVTKVNDILSVGKITESVPLDETASNHIIIAGGIGITAFLAVIQLFDKINYNYELHYAVRSSNDVAFKSLLEPMATKVKIYDKIKGERMDLKGIIRDRKWNSHVYVCGPERMMEAVLAATMEYGMSSDEVHYEAFQTVTSGDPFTVEVVGREGTLNVGPEETLLEVLRKAGLEIQSSCEVGNCGTCTVKVCKGKVEHRGSALSDDEKDKVMLSCVSRGVGHILVEIEP